MLSRIRELMEGGADFAFETTLASKSYVALVKRAQEVGYKVTLLFIWLDSPLTARQRVAARVAKGGHGIPADVIERRYYRGIYNLVHLYLPICDRWMIVDNETVTPRPIVEGGKGIENIIVNEYIWALVNEQAKRDGL